MMGNQLQPQFQNGIQERSVVPFDKKNINYRHYNIYFQSHLKCFTDSFDNASCEKAYNCRNPAIMYDERLWTCLTCNVVKYDKLLSFSTFYAMSHYANWKLLMYLTIFPQNISPKYENIKMSECYLHDIK